MPIDATFDTDYNDINITKIVKISQSCSHILYCHIFMALSVRLPILLLEAVDWVVVDAAMILRL